FQTITWYCRLIPTPLARRSATRCGATVGVPNSPGWSLGRDDKTAGSRSQELCGGGGSLRLAPSTVPSAYHFSPKGAKDTSQGRNSWFTRQRVFETSNGPTATGS